MRYGQAIVGSLRDAVIRITANSCGKAGAAPARAQTAPEFLDYTQAQLDLAYDQAVWAPQLRALKTELEGRYQEAIATA